MPDVVDQLRERIRTLSFGEARVIFVVGHPRSSIGKGHLIARLASLVDGPATAIKYEGMLNTNDSNNHPSPTDDIATYSRFCPNIAMGWPNQILAGEVIRDFINKYGGTGRDHLMFVPHLSQHLALHFHEAWRACGSPPELFIELGGTLTDPELTAFALPCVAQVKARHGRVAVVLLTEVAYDGGEPKARPLRQALYDAQALGLQLDLVFVRLPAGVPPQAIETVSGQIEAKLSESQVYAGRSPVIVPVPHFGTDALEGYRDHLARYVALLPYGAVPSTPGHQNVARGAR